MCSYRDVCPPSRKKEREKMKSLAMVKAQQDENLKKVLSLPEYFSGPKSCFNCLHFKMKIPVIKVAFGGKDGQAPTSHKSMLRFYTDTVGRKRGEHDPVARCVLRNLIRGDWKGKNEGKIIE